MESKPKCPKCGSQMVLRTARRGKFAGKSFFGCSTYPSCKGIIDYDPTLYGEVDQSETEGLEPRPSPSLNLDLPPSQPAHKISIPVQVECHPKNNGRQSVFFEAASLPIEVPGIIRRARVEPRILRSFSQWRLDFPLPAEIPSDPVLTNILAVVEKILLRGSLTSCSPNIDSMLRNFVVGEGELEKPDWIESFGKAASFGESKDDFANFDSQEEERFYQEILPTIAPDREIHAWAIPQISAASLTQGSIDPSSKQRVDFLICHPNGIQLVIEIDGLQHDVNIDADKRRDELLQASGINVVRVPASEVRKANGPAIEQVKSLLEEIPVLKSEQPPSSLELALMLAKAGGQIQVALLYALRGGHLHLDSDPEWSISFDRPSWCQDQEAWELLVEEAVGDFVALIHSIYRLYRGNELQVTKSIHHGTERADPEVKSRPIAIIFGSPGSVTDHTGIFEISDTCFPHHIAFSLPVSAGAVEITPDHDTVEYLLYYIFRKDTFWEGQWEAISRSLEGRDSIVLLPTGGGKSIAFQLASLLMPGPCLVIDPLIALINDQIDNLRITGIDRVVGITSDLSFDDRRIALDGFARGNYLFCYITPERLQIEGFRDALLSVTMISAISLIAIDEAHCVSEWGHDFRTSYLNVARNARNYCEHKGYVPPLLGLTGTASRSVLKDMQRELEILDFDSIVTPKSFDRPELYFRVVHCSSSEKRARLKGYLASLPGLFGISKNIFFQPRGSETYAGLIFYPHVNGEYGVSAGYQDLREQISSLAIYSGKAPKGIPKGQWGAMKALYAEQFKHNEKNLLVCTNAFGMGIDKPNIRYTVHMNMPRSIEAFYQEAGRAGRDRKKADCCLVMSNDHPQRSRTLLNPSTPLNEISEIVSNVDWGEEDDITRMMYFHANSFRGVEGEKQAVWDLISEIGDIEQRRTVNIGYSSDERNNEREKAVHRLTILGVIEDYTHDYAREQFKIRLSGAEKDHLLEKYVKYLQGYNLRRAETAGDKAKGFLEEPYQQFVRHLVGELTNFIYSTIELGRRSALAEMLQVSSSGSTDEVIRRRILDYLELGRYSELLDMATDRSEELPLVVKEIIDQVTSPNEAAELRGQTARLLESYPDNPALLLIRALAEFMSRDRNVQVASDNLGASVKFALSEDGWALSETEVVDAVGIIIDKAASIDVELSWNLVRSYLRAVENVRSSARAIISKTSIESSAPAAEILLELISNELENVLD